jgi:NhaP-type Na+/H+ or K+/H+ antiporter
MRVVLVVLAGLVFGHSGLGLLEPNPSSHAVDAIAVIALVVILFRDGLEVDAESLQTAWHPPLRKLVLAMPITCVLAAWITHLVTSLDWTQSFLVGALLSPTDPVLTSSVVTNPRVPRMIRHSLNLESGLNDGLALPAVLAFAYSLDPSKANFVWWQFVLQDVLLGFVVGIALGWLASRRVPRRRLIYGLVVAFGTYGIAKVVHGNGLIAVFVGAITLGILRDEVVTAFEHEAEQLVAVVKYAIFFVFGLLISIKALFGDGGEGIAIVAFTLLAARPVAVLIALVRTRFDFVERLFMGWFGPKGVATLTFAVLVLNEHIPDGRHVFNIAALGVLVSVVAHGLSDKPGAEALARHADAASA